MKGPVRLAILGCGAITRSEHIPSVIAHPGTQLVALVDVDLSRANGLIQKRALTCKATPTRALFSHRFVARRVRRRWIRGARSSARGGVLEQYVEHGEQAQRSRRGLIARRSRKLVRNAG